MNAALGFDSYLVMRHGVKPAANAPEDPALPAAPTLPLVRRLGCYYCNDIVAPTDVRIRSTVHTFAERTRSIKLTVWITPALVSR